MRHPLIRQGEGPAAAYERQRAEREAERAKLEQVIADTYASATSTAVTRGTAAGDERKLRGVPVQARGVGGTIPGTDPLAAALANRRQPR